MNEQIEKLAKQAGLKLDDLPDDVFIPLEKFAELIVKQVLERIDKEIGLAYEQDQAWTAATLEALALEILEDFDMELDLEDEEND